MHINNPRVEEKIRVLAKSLGTTLTGAIDISVTKELRRTAPRQPDPNYVEDLRRMAAEIRMHLKPGLKSTDDQDLYDENGLFG